MKICQALSFLWGISRRKAVELIKAKRVFINKKPIDSYAYLLQNKDEILVKTDKVLTHIWQESVQELTREYYAFYKPRGVITDQKNLAYYYKQMSMAQLKYVGRLDKESEGLLLLSNDGDFIHQLSHPSYDHTKVYEVHVKGWKNMNQLNMISDRMKVSEIRQHPEDKDTAICTIHLTEGQNRQIRRIITSMGLYVNKLVRVAHAGYKLSDLKPKLKPGQWIAIPNKKADLRKAPLYPKLQGKKI